MKILRQLLLHETADRLASEIQLVGGMQAMGEAATCVHLQRLLRLHQQESEGRVESLGGVFQSFGEETVTGSCGATQSFLEESRQVASEFLGSPAINSALLCMARKIRHHEIASYSCLRDWAQLLGHKDAACLFAELLGKGEAADISLVELSRSRSNNEAKGPQGDVGATCDLYGHIG